MNALLNHNTAELPLIAKMYNNELHLMREAFQDIEETDPDVQAALTDRLADLIELEKQGARMASIVD